MEVECHSANNDGSGELSVFPAVRSMSPAEGCGVIKQHLPKLENSVFLMLESLGVEPTGRDGVGAVG